MNKTKLISSLGSAVTISLLTTPMAQASENPFAMQDMPNAMQLAEDGGKGAEGKCGEGKCGSKNKEASTSAAPADKAPEAKCGEGKCGSKNKEASSSAAPTDKAPEAKCGEGKCGSKNK